MTSKKMRRKSDLRLVAMSLEEILVATLIMSVLTLAVFESMRMVRSLGRMTQKGAEVSAEAFASNGRKTFIQDSLSLLSYKRLKEVQDSCERAVSEEDKLLKLE